MILYLPKNGNNVCEAFLILNSILESFGHQDKLLGSQQDLITVFNDSVLKIAGNLEAEDSVARFTWALAASVQIDSGLKVIKLYLFWEHGFSNKICTQ